METAVFLKNPHCPDTKVTLCAVGEIYSSIIEQLENRGIQVLKVPYSDKVSKPVAYHPDLRMGLLGNGRAMVARDDQLLKRRLRENGFDSIILTDNQKPIYPEEALLDFLVLDSYWIHSKKLMEASKLQLSDNEWIELPVNQGYTKCGIAVVSSKAVITSDPVIGRKLKNHGFDVLMIAPGHIKLDGYDTGFIGGCCGLIAPDQLAVAGDLAYHPDGDIIKEFLRKYHVWACSLQSGPLCDIGGILPLKQQPAHS